MVRTVVPPNFRMHGPVRTARTTQPHEGRLSVSIAAMPEPSSCDLAPCRVPVYRAAGPAYCRMRPACDRPRRPGRTRCRYPVHVPAARSRNEAVVAAPAGGHPLRTWDARRTALGGQRAATPHVPRSGRPFIGSSPAPSGG